MTTKKINLLILLLIIIGLGGCGEKDPPPAEDPSKDIIGKWEKIAEGPDEDGIVPVKASGVYIECLPNGEYKNSYWRYSKHIYQTDSLFLYLYNLDNSEAVNVHIYEYTFINRNTLKLKHVYGVVPAIPGFPLIDIYQRIK